MEKSIRNLPGVSVLEAKAASIIFKSDLLEQLNPEFRELAESYQNEQQDLLKQLLDACGGSLFTYSVRKIYV
jgi:hypothetical protein